MLTTPKWLGLLAVAFVAGSFIASPELRAFAANTVGSADIINNSIQSVDIKDGEVKTADLGGNALTSAKIKDGEVKTADLGSNAVNSAKIADGTISYADASRSFVKVEHKEDCNCGAGTGWDPDGTSPAGKIFDAAIAADSVVSVTMDVGIGQCETIIETSGNAIVFCNNVIPNGTGINYAIFNN